MRKLDQLSPALQSSLTHYHIARLPGASIEDLLRTIDRHNPERVAFESSGDAAEAP